MMTIDRIRTISCIATWLCLAIVSVQSQNAIGIVGALSSNISSANFEQLDGVLNCNSTYRSGYALAPSAGLYYDIPITGTMALQLRGSYRNVSTNLTSGEFTAIGVDGVKMDARIDHSLDASIGMAGFQPAVKVNLLADLSFMAGIEAGYILSQSFEQRETLVRPSDIGAFENGLRIHNVQTGPIPHLNRLQLSLQTGFSYSLPLNRASTLQLVPEVSYSYIFTPLVQGLQWNIASASIGIGIRYVVPQRAQQAPVVEPPPSIDTMVIAPIVVLPPKPALPLATIRVTGIDTDGSENVIAMLRVEEIASTKVIPTLPYIFFDEDHTSLPDRYTHDSRGDALATHHDMLHEIGRRMTSNNDVLIINGIISNIKNAIITPHIASVRAEAVSAFIQHNYGIDPTRIKVRVTPLNASSTPAILDADGIAEINRVELSCTQSSSLLAPVRQYDTTRSATPPVLRFYPGVSYSTQSNLADITSWEVMTSQGNIKLKSFRGNGQPPSTLDWTLADDQIAIPTIPGTLDVELRIHTKEDTVVARTAISVDMLTLRRKKSEYIAGKEVEHFNIVLFDIGSAELTAEQRRIIESDIKPRIRKNSTVTVIGHTDRIGETSSNAALSLLRAQNTAKALGVSTLQAQGRGEAERLFDNVTPEARCLSRTVEVIIETPPETP